MQFICAFIELVLILGTIDVTVGLSRKISVAPGRTLCVTCHKIAANLNNLDKNENNEAFQDQNNFIPVEYEANNDAEVHRFNQIYNSLLQPTETEMKYNCEQRVRAAKRKCTELSEVAMTLLATSHNLPLTQLNYCHSYENKAPNHSDLTADYIALLSEVKKKFQEANSVKEKTNLLTLAPKSWSREKTAKYFDCPVTMARRAKHSRDEDGILSCNKFQKRKKISDDLKKAVVEFYLREDISRFSAGMKECKTVKLGGVRQRVQRRYLLDNLRALHVRFLDELSKLPPTEKTSKISFSKFAELRPAWCMPVGYIQIKIV